MVWGNGVIDRNELGINVCLGWWITNLAFFVVLTPELWQRTKYHWENKYPFKNTNVEKDTKLLIKVMKDTVDKMLVMTSKLGFAI